MKLQEEKIEGAITELIDQVERFFNVAPLRFLDIDGGNDDVGCFTFPIEHETRFSRFENWFQHLLETLDPFYGEDEEKSSAGEEIIEAVLPDEVKSAWGEFYNATTSLMFPAQHVGFYVGVFVGAKRQGATRADLVEIGKGLVQPCLQRWEIAQSNAQDRAKRETEAKKKERRRAKGFKLVEGGKKDSGPEMLKGDFNA